MNFAIPHPATIRLWIDRFHKHIFYICETSLTDQFPNCLYIRFCINSICRSLNENGTKVYFFQIECLNMYFLLLSLVLGDHRSTGTSSYSSFILSGLEASCRFLRNTLLILLLSQKVIVYPEHARLTRLQPRLGGSTNCN